MYRKFKFKNIYKIQYSQLLVYLNRVIYIQNEVLLIYNINYIL